MVFPILAGVSLPCGAAIGAGAMWLCKLKEKKPACRESKPQLATGASSAAADFSGKIAMVTGAASGIGLQISARLAKAGAHVIMLDRKQEELEAAAQDIGGTPLVVDLSDTKEICAVVSKAGKVDMLVNCAGVAIFQPFFEGTVDVFDITFDVNVRSIWLLSQQVAKGMVERGSSGAIVSISSQSSTVVVSTKHLAYSCSKASIDHLTRSMAIALAPHKIRVNCVNPTVVRTELAVKAHGEEGLKKMAEKVPLGEICSPDNVADGVLFLLSDQASMITGTMLPIDGGFTVARL